MESFVYTVYLLSALGFAMSMSMTEKGDLFDKVFVFLVCLVIFPLILFGMIGAFLTRK